MPHKTPLRVVASDTPPSSLSVPINSNTLSLILGGVLLFTLFSGGKGCDLSPSPTPTPSAAVVTPTADMLAACAPIKAAVASADPAKRKRLATAFMDLALALQAAGGNIKTTGTLSDLIGTFTKTVAAAEPDLAGPTSAATNQAFTASRDALIAKLPGTGADKPITQAQAADFVAAISKSFE